jgi:hypothetical protein
MLIMPTPMVIAAPPAQQQIQKSAYVMPPPIKQMPASMTVEGNSFFEKNCMLIV